MKLNYRNEIDGLRAIAIISVIIYHAKIYFGNKLIFEGGYLGVDIFFVISGFLISQLIFKEINETKNISLKRFFDRRIRRIIPSLLIVIIFSYPFFFFTLIPLDLSNYSISIFYTLGFLSNFHFHYSGIEYGGISSLLKPFLHTWSLAIEEQFYIIFPFFILFTIKFLKKHLLIILFIACLVSLSFAEVSSKTHPSFNFYILFSRGWELLIGSILAYIVLYKNHLSKSVPKNLKEFLVLFSLLIILGSFFIFDNNTSHPSLITLIPILSISIIILLSDKSLTINKVLTFKPISYIGLISYSLYLWHYPIFAFARLNNLFDNIFQKIFCILISLLLSIVTYYLIENKFRNKKIVNTKILYSSLISCLVIIFLLNDILTKKHLRNFPTDLVEFDFRPWQKLRNQTNIICHNNPNFCKFIKKKEYKNIYIIGDSHMSVLMYDFKKRYVDDSKLNLITMTTGCLGLPGFEFKKNGVVLNDICNSDYYDEVLKTVNSSKNNLVILGGRFPLYLSDGDYFNNKEGGIESEGEKFYKLTNISNNINVSDGYIKFINDLLNSSSNLILIYPIPEVGFNVPRRIFNSIKQNKNSYDNSILEKNKITTSYKRYIERTHKTFETFKKINNKKLIRIYPEKIFCNKISNRCITHTDDEILYSDSNHLSISGARILNDVIINELNKLNY